MHSRTGNGPTLVPLHGPGEHKPRTLDRDTSTVGRARGCDLVLEASDVSTIHCVVFHSADGYHVRDCNSRTGTRINGNATRGSPLLHDGDILQVGPFSFELKLAGVTMMESAANPAQVLRLHASRRALAEHALRLRRHLHARDNAQPAGAEAEIQYEAARLREKVRTYDRRLAELEEADRELAAERAALGARVQDAEKALAERLEDAEKQTQAQTRESQQGCQKEEAALHAQSEQQVTHRERQEFDDMKKQLENGQVEAQTLIDRQRAALSQQDAALKSQRAEVARMIGELRQLQEELRRPHKAELQTLAEENERLRQAVTDYAARLTQPAETATPTQELEDARAETELVREVLDERERQLAELHDQLATAKLAETPGASKAKLAPLKAENELLKQLLAEKDSLVEELREKAEPKSAKSASELEQYEAELNEYRLQMETDRGTLTQELEQLRVRNQELDDATREMEMEMSRERAEMGRERIRVERMRDELKIDMDKMHREMSVRESLAPVQRLRDEMAQKKQPGAASNPGERMRTLRGSNDTPRG
jgi:FHA domain